jgi:hypothetical protein
MISYVGEGTVRHQADVGKLTNATFGMSAQICHRRDIGMVKGLS